MSSGRSKNGFALISFLLIISLVGTFLALCVYQSQNSLVNAKMAERKLRATYAARAGLDIVLSELDRDPQWQPTGPEIRNLHYGTDLQALIEVKNNYSGPGPITFTTSTGTTVNIPARQVWVRTVGMVNGVETAVGQGAAEALLVKPPIKLDYAITAPVIIAIALHDFRCYDSTDPSLPLQEYALPADARVHCNLRNISFTNNYRVPEDLETFQLGTQVDGNLSWSARSPQVFGTLTGSQTPLPDEPEPLVFRCPPEFLDVAGANVTLSGTSQTLAPGKYGVLEVEAGTTVELQSGDYYAESILLGPNAKLILGTSVTPDDPALIYLSHRLQTREGAEINWASNPTPGSLQIYSTDQEGAGRTFITLEGSKAAFVAAGHNLEVTLLGGHLAPNIFAGALRGAHVHADGTNTDTISSQMYYDMALENWEPRGKPCWVISKELNDEE